MNRTITVELLNEYFEKLKSRLNTGMDKITSDKFMSCKETILENVVRKSKDHTYKFTKLKHYTLASKRKVFIPTIRDRIILDYLKDCINERYKTNYVSRDLIVSSLRCKLEADIDFLVIRLDIKDFFNSIPSHRLIDKLRTGCLLSSIELYLVKEAMKLSSSGLPPGLSISSSLSEIYLERLDFQLKRLHPRLNCYYRYVDDIILILNGYFTPEEEAKIKIDINSIFKECTLDINKSKERYIRISYKPDPAVSFEYLGYKFIKDKNKKVSLYISESKLKKFYNKINFSFYEYRRKGNFSLLFERLLLLLNKNLFLSIKPFFSKDGKIKTKTRLSYFGLLESYKFIELSQWSELDKFIIRKINSIKRITSRKQRCKLHSLSLMKNYESKKIHCIHRHTKQQFIEKIMSIDTSVTASSLRNLELGELKEQYFKLTKIL